MNVCSDPTHLRVYDVAGTCSAGACVYGSQLVGCTCTAGACATPCLDGSTCTTPPASVCIDSTTIRVFTSPGVCTGVCNYSTFNDLQCPIGTPLCRAGVCVNGYPGPSCKLLADTCGPNGDQSCCANSVVPGGTFKRSFDAVTYTDAAHPATVSDFRLDTYPVTIGRFRKFAKAGVYSRNLIPSGAGKNPNNPADTGWNTAWNATMPLDGPGLANVVQGARGWTVSPGANENFPMTYVTWYEAQSFCIWDGGRLPTEAEWNYAAAGGAEQRAYPWSNPPTDVTIDCTYANYATIDPVNGTGVYCSSTIVSKVGSKSPKGDGRWGHADLAGNVWQLTQDWHVPTYPTPCVDCANLTPGTYRVMRGGAGGQLEGNMLASHRTYADPALRYDFIGWRCARPL